jgi:tetratricopeptide (TPR) repeat protein
MRRARCVAAVLSAAALSIASHAQTPAAMHAAGQLPASVAQWAEGARLLPGLGDFHRPITTSSALAQQYFDQGLRLAWAFNHDEAARSFAQAARLDPACAICYWGVALSVGPNYNMSSMDTVRAQVAWEALHEAQANAVSAAPVEQALIGALAARYPSADAIGPNNLDAVQNAYARAMEAVAARFADDLDVQTLCAEAEMNVHAWKLWTPEGTPVEGTLAIEARLEAVLRCDPGHPGANHYYIHVMEGSSHPQAALPSAQRLSGMMPAAGHLEHMPAHIMERIGRYEAAAEANRRAVNADLAYLATLTPPDHYAMYLVHNYSFLAYAVAMEGRKAETLTVVQQLVEHAPLSMQLAMGQSGWSTSQQYAALVRFGLWDELIALGPPDAQAPGLTAAYLYGRGVALAARGRTDEARHALDELRALAEGVPAEGHALRSMLSIAQPIVAARIAATLAHNEEAVTLLQEAVAVEDALPYNEPPDWFFPVRHLLGAQLLIAARPAQAERVYREDLRRNPDNGWALFGLAAALRAQGEPRAAARVTQALKRAWAHADVPLEGSAFWFAGADVTTCECQRTTARVPAGGS